MMRKSHRWIAGRAERSAPRAMFAAAAWIAAWALTAAVAWGAEPSPGDKLKFLQSLCERMDNHERCLNAGTLVLGRSVNWLIFEGCSASGSREAVVACFDRAHRMAFELTGDARFEKAYQHCNRFEGGMIAEAKMLCYRANFKYANNNNALRERAEKSESGAAGLKK